MKKQMIGYIISYIMSAIAGIILVVSNIPQNIILAAVGGVIFLAAVIGMIHCHLAPQSLKSKDIEKKGFNREAHLELEPFIRNKKQVEEIIIIAYTANGAYHALDIFKKHRCHVKETRILLRNPLDIKAGEGDPCAIPNTPAQVKIRLKQMEVHLLDHILNINLEDGIFLNRPKVRFYNGVPVLRGIIIDGEQGLFSIYTERENSQQNVDFSATSSVTTNKVVILSRNGGSEERIMIDFIRWFNLVWEHGSNSYSEEELRRKFDLISS